MSSVSPEALKVIVVTLEPELASSRMDYPAGVMRSLGHDITVVGYDLTEVRETRPRSTSSSSRPAPTWRSDATPSSACAPSMLSARPASCWPCDVTRVAGLDPEIGADDFVLMPVVPRELSARLRQLGWRETMGQGGRIIRQHGFVLDCVSLQATTQGRRAKLTPYEFQLLKFLMERSGVVFSREELLRRVWGYRHVGRVRTVDTHILNLRGKLGPAGDSVEAVRGMGYKLRRPKPRRRRRRPERAPVDRVGAGRGRRPAQPRRAPGRFRRGAPRMERTRQHSLVEAKVIPFPRSHSAGLRPGRRAERHSGRPPLLLA